MNLHELALAAWSLRWVLATCALIVAAACLPHTPWTPGDWTAARERRRSS